MFIAIGESIIARVAALGGYISFSVTDCPKTRYEQVQLLWYTATIHVPMTIGQNLALYANYVPNVLRHGVLRDPNHSLRIDYTLQ